MTNLLLLFPFYNRKLRHRQVNNFGHSHTAGKWQSEDLNASSQVLKHTVSTSSSHSLSNASIRQVSLSMLQVQKQRLRRVKLTCLMFHS